MRHAALILGLTATLAGFAAAPASARRYCEARAHQHKVVGTVLGAAGGALIGGAIGGHGAAGPLLGAAGGAVVGNQLARSKCVRYRHHHYQR